jgi:hypothetical protein
MYKLFVVTFSGGQALDTKVIEFDTLIQANNAAELLMDATGKSFNCVITKLYK